MKHSDLAMLNKAHEIAFLAHHETGATRGGQGNLPYYIHCIEVAGETLEVILDLPPVFLSPYTVVEVAAAAVLHDVPEDCDKKWLIEIEKLNKNVLDLALMLRNGHMELPEMDEPPVLSRLEKKKLDFAKLADPARVHVAVIPIKYKDRLCNLRGMAHWTSFRQRRYAVEETPLLLEVLDKRMGGFPNPFVEDANAKLKQEILDEIEKVKERTDGPES